MIENKYDPKTKSNLSETLFNREIFDKIIGCLETDSELPNHSWLVAGDEGVGKSHLLALLDQEIRANQKISQSFRTVYLPEMFGVDSLYRLYLKVAKAVCVNEDTRKDEYEQIKAIRLTGSLEVKKKQRYQLSLNLYELLWKVRDGRNYLLLIDDADETLGKFKIEDVRQYVSQQLDYEPIFSVIAASEVAEPVWAKMMGLVSIELTSPRDLEDYKNYLFKYITREQYNRNAHMVDVWRLITGGNPLMGLHLVDRLNERRRIEPLDLVSIIMEMSPVFANKVRGLPFQQRIIIDAIAMGAPTQTPSEIGVAANIDLKLAAIVCGRLAKSGWLKVTPLFGPGIKGNETFYALKDNVFRYWYQLRHGRNDPIDFIRSCRDNRTEILSDETDYIISHAYMLQDRVKLSWHVDPLIKDICFWRYN